MQDVLLLPDAGSEQRVEGRRTSDLNGVLPGRVFRRI